MNVIDEINELKIRLAEAEKTILAAWQYAINGATQIPCDILSEYEKKHELNKRWMEKKSK